MKKIIIAFSIIGAVITGCNKEENNQPASCSNGVMDGTETGIDCGGSCTACACPTGYEGTNCATEMRAKFIRNVMGTDSCDSGPDPNHQMTITADPSDITKVRILGLNSNVYYPGVAQANGTLVIGPAEAGGAVVSGTGVLVGTKLRINYTLTVPGAVSYTCLWVQD